MSEALATGPGAARLDELLALRSELNRAFFEREAGRIARLCHRMAERFARGGRLLAIGAEGAARSDARHVTVEFVHPVIVGKRALPAIGIAEEGGALEAQAELLARPEDIAIGFGIDDAGDGAAAAAAALAACQRVGCLTVAFAPARSGERVARSGEEAAAGDRAGPADWTFAPPGEDPFVRQELAETLYHLLWELVHVFFDHRGLLEGRAEGAKHDAGGSSFLYPFLAEAETDLDGVLADVERSIALKAEEVGELREQTLGEGREALLAAAAELRRRFDAGGKLLAFGNGGSATDATDLVADLRAPPGERWPARPAMDLTEDPGIITAIANDVGVEEVFQRQVIAYGDPGDVAIALSTSGGSLNLIEALAEARRRGLATIAMVGYDGGRIAAEALADHVVISRSQNIPRIQEAQASAYHVLRELVEEA